MVFLRVLLFSVYLIVFQETPLLCLVTAPEQKPLSLYTFLAASSTQRVVQTFAFTFSQHYLSTYLSNVFCSSRMTKTSPALQGSSATALPALQLSEQVPLTSPSLKPLQMDEEDSLSPHLLLPDSISQLEEFGRQKKWHKKQHKHHRQRQFNDLWVRIEDR